MRRQQQAVRSLPNFPLTETVSENAAKELVTFQSPREMHFPQSEGNTIKGSGGSLANALYLCIMVIGHSSRPEGEENIPQQPGKSRDSTLHIPEPPSYYPPLGPRANLDRETESKGRGYASESANVPKMA